MPYLPGSEYPVGGDVQAIDDGKGDIIPVEAGIQGEFFGVWGGNGSGVNVSTSTDAP